LYIITNALTLAPSRYFPVLTFAVPPAIIAGQLYHIVFTNIDANPTANYLSVDALYQQNPLAPGQPTVSDADLAVLLQYQNAGWAPRKGYTPIFQLTYTDASCEGVGYMEAWVGAPKTVSGTSAVRESITVSGAPKTVTSVAVRVARVSGSDPLIVRLENADGTLVEQGYISAASITMTSPISYDWATYTFASAHTLASGQTYHVDFEATSSSTYQFFPIRKGYAQGFQNTTYFPDGFAQFKQAGNWVGWTQWGVTNRVDSDLQFYFGLAPAAPPSPVISNAVVATWTSATITWTTDEPSTSQVQYGASTSYAGLTSVNSSLVTNHSVTLDALTASTVYHYRVISTNGSGGQTISGDLTFATQ
jgi:Purple acid Phosphatase, N-terminal domain